MLTNTTHELRSEKPSLLMRAVTWFMARRTPVFPDDAAEFAKRLNTRRKPQDAAMPKSFERRFLVERREVLERPVVTLHPRSGPAEWHILYFHGGGFVLPMFKEHWPLAAALVERCGLSVTVPLYDVVPEASHREQDALADACFAELAADHAPDRIVLSGDSAGGHMALSLAVRLSRVQGPRAAKLALFAPWLDLTAADPLIAQVEPRDIMLRIDPLRECGRMYADGRDPASPECSPLFLSQAELSALPPTRIWTGRHDLFIVDSRTFAARLREAGIDAKLYEYEGAPHVFMAITPTREAKDTFALLRQFLEE